MQKPNLMQNSVKNPAKVVVDEGPEKEADGESQEDKNVDC